ncbi:MAG: ABC transporter permease subunit [Myxococcales bacterium]|nr:ABC transporter permease subunit [Myxococcales bacterium]
MRVAWTIAKRDIYSFFVSPVAYVVIAVWLLWTGLSFYVFAQWLASAPGGQGDSPLAYFFGQSILFFIPQLVFVPVMTMRLVAGESASGTLESLLTAPVREWEVVLGKYLAAMTFWLALWVPTLLYVWLTQHYGDVDFGSVASSYLGVAGIGLYYMAIGLFASTVARNQIIAAVITFMFLGALFALGILQYVVHDARDFFAYLSVWSHMQDFSKGIVDSRYLVYDVTLAALALFLSVRVLESRRYQ